MVTVAAPGWAGRVTTSGRLVTDLAGAGGGTVTNERGGQKNGDIERASSGRGVTINRLALS